jgi:hypothetical protein
MRGSPHTNVQSTRAGFLLSCALTGRRSAGSTAKRARSSFSAITRAASRDSAAPGLDSGRTWRIDRISPLVPTDARHSSARSATSP